MISKTVKILEAEDRLVARGWGRGRWRAAVQWHEVSVMQHEYILEISCKTMPMVNNTVLYT